MSIRHVDASRERDGRSLLNDRTTRLRMYARRYQCEVARITAQLIPVEQKTHGREDSPEDGRGLIDAIFDRFAAVLKLETGTTLDRRKFK